MNIFFLSLILGISLSMDAFSLSILIGAMLNKRKSFNFIIFVMLFHFFMPILGSLLGYKLNNTINLDGNFIFAAILIVLSIQVFISIIKKEEIEEDFSIYKLILLAFGVAIDSFTLGFGLSFKDTNILINAVVFSITSGFFTYIGMLIGKYSSQILGDYAKIIGALLMLSFGIYHLF